MIGINRQQASEINTGYLVPVPVVGEWSELRLCVRGVQYCFLSQSSYSDASLYSSPFRQSPLSYFCESAFHIINLINLPCPGANLFEKR